MMNASLTFKCVRAAKVSIHQEMERLAHGMAHRHTMGLLDILELRACGNSRSIIIILDREYNFPTINGSWHSGGGWIFLQRALLASLCDAVNCNLFLSERQPESPLDHLMYNALLINCVLF
jgi:hypothetical protein